MQMRLLSGSSEIRMAFLSLKSKKNPVQSFPEQQHCVVDFEKALSNFLMSGRLKLYFIERLKVL